MTTSGVGLILWPIEVFMYTIGDFSKIAGLTVKTLRFYHEQGLLIPSAVDDKTGYRYYDRSKIETARVITHLKSLDLTIEEIGAILRDAKDDADLRDIMERQKALLESKIKRYRMIVRSLNQFLAAEAETRKLMTKPTFQVEEKTILPLLIAGIRMKGRYANSGTGFSRIGKSLGRYICGKPMLLHYDAEFRQDDADFEACMPVRTEKQVDGISIRRISGGRCVSCLHNGPYEQMGRSYAKILDYIRGKGYEVQMPTREIYLKGPGMIFAGNPSNYLTEIQIMIEDGASAKGAEPSNS
jgi:DNA-binding transcriptional MerR regulator/effector-binding domain-containing protein